MIMIDEILVSGEVLDKRFACDLKKCKGACCWEGDLGAPIDDEECAQIEESLEIVLPYLDHESRSIIENKGAIDIYDDEYVTPLKDDGACVYLVGEKGSSSRCAFEMAFSQAKIEFHKPISCHLYPIRISKNKKLNFESLNYDQWDICKDAVRRGDSEEIELLDFVKAALIRKYGQDFYQQLMEARQQWLVNQQS